MLTTAELTALAKQTAIIVREATGPLLKRIAELEACQPGMARTALLVRRVTAESPARLPMKMPLRRCWRRTFGT
jgi:hypothetical protein